MELPKISYNDFDLDKVLGEVPKLRFKTTVRDINRSTGLHALVHISRITFDIELHDAKDSSSSNEIGCLGTTNSVEPVTLNQGSSAYVFFSIPLNSTIIERMLEIRDKERHVAFKINATIVALYFVRQQNGYILQDILQAQCFVWENTRHGETSLILIPADKLSQLLIDIRYTERMKFEIPLYIDTSSVNESLRKTVTLLKAAAGFLERGNNEGALIDVRKALTNYLLVDRNGANERILDNSIRTDWLGKSPTDVARIYEDILLRLQEGLRAVLKITDKFLHDDKVKMPPLRRDVEYVYFTVAYIVSRLIDNY